MLHCIPTNSQHHKTGYVVTLHQPNQHRYSVLVTGGLLYEAFCVFFISKEAVGYKKKKDHVDMSLTGADVWSGFSPMSIHTHILPPLSRLLLRARRVSHSHDDDDGGDGHLRKLDMVAKINIFFSKTHLLARTLHRDLYVFTPA